MKHSVATYRSAGLEARWGKARSGAPAIFVRNPSSPLPHQRTTWWLVTRDMFRDMESVEVLEGFNRHTLLADVFSIPA